MRSRFILLFPVLIFGVLVWGCAAPERGTDVSVKGANRPDGSNTAEPVTVNLEAANLESAVPPGSFADKARGKPIVDVPTSAPRPLQFQKADEDSEIATTMNGDGAIFEVRRFRRNPQLAKVEATWRGAKEKDLKIFLRSGHVLDVTTERIANLQSASAQLLLEIAGIQVPRRPNEKSRETEKKRRAQ